MEMRFTHSARRAAGVGAAALGLLVMGACDNPQETLLEQQQPQVILPQDVQNPTGAVGLYTGALGRLRSELNGGTGNQEALWNLMALMTDEFKSGDTFSQRNDSDQRITQPNDNVMRPTYEGVQQARGRARDAIVALKAYAPTETAKIGEMYMVMGFFELTLGQNFCNGIPLGETSGGQPQYTDPLTNAQVFTTAIARFDSALTVLTGTDAQTVHVRNATLIAKARAQVNLNQVAAAATTVAGVLTTYQYLLTYSSNTQNNEWWQMGTSSRRYTVGDSFDVSGVTKNAIPFASLNDPRVKTARSTTLPRAFDNITPFIEFTNYGREDALPLLSGIDARLIEAEAKLRANDIPGMMLIINSLRTTQQKIGNYSPATQAALPDPANQVAATDLYFREKALWQFGRGERISDLRRLVRQYTRTQENVFPSGPFHKNGTYGTNTSFPVPDAEKANSKFTGCIDRNA